jgi:hypothetical protein
MLPTGGKPTKIFQLMPTPSVRPKIILTLSVLLVVSALLPLARAAVFLTGKMERPLRYSPVGTDFVITNGGEFFNRSLYGGSSPFRVDAGDVPEFSLYLPGRGGNLRLGVRAGSHVKWLQEMKTVVARYRAGSMLYEIRDPLLGAGELQIAAVVARAEEGLIVRAEINGAKDAELVFAFGGVNGLKGRRDGDIGCEAVPVAQFFQLRPDQCAGNQFQLSENSFTVRGKPGVIAGVFSAPAGLALADAGNWNHAAEIFSATKKDLKQPVVAGSLKLTPGKPGFIALQKLASAADADALLATYREVEGQPGAVTRSAAAKPWRADALREIFEREDEARRTIAERVTVTTPDPFVNASVPALNIAADAVWDDRQEAYLHGGVAWRVRLLGWRVSYAGDELGWHDRTAKHFAGFARQQNTNEISETIPAPEESANLSRNENALHSNGDLSRNHYDMNLVGVDAFFRHLLWTGDLEFARAMWLTIERHLAWERRLFRREFGVEKLPLYEAYCCIWASDDLAYNGGGATHSSAYNLYHNRMAARVAKLLGKDATPYEREAELIASGMEKNLWLADRGWFAEWKDLLGLQLVHPNAAAWTFYHTLDSEVPSPLEAWQMTRFVDTQIARFPIEVGERQAVIGNAYTIPTTSWMPYTWSLNNVVLAETMHTALGYWQANRSEGAFPLFKGALLDSMYLGLCPGNVGMCTWFDATRRESQRDFGDGSGTMSRTVVEGLFGVKPDLLDGEVILQPGFPAEWDNANIRHPDFEFSFQRQGLTETYALENKFGRPLKLQLSAVALRDGVASVTVNGRAVRWRNVENGVGTPRIEIEADAALKQTVVIEWRGEKPASPLALPAVAAGGSVAAVSAATLTALADPQGALSAPQVAGNQLTGRATGTPGHRTVFGKVKQGDLNWWQPVTFEIQAPAPAPSLDWSAPIAAKLEPQDLAAQFNDSVTQIFRNEYRTPRSPFASLATPKQGIGSWCHPKDTFTVDDSGLRALAAKAGGKIVLPNGVPLATPGEAGAKNIAFVSQWENYPREISVPLAGKSSHAFLLMAGSTTAMQSRFDNGEVIVTYTDGSTTRLPLENPTTWWPIDQDYYIDDFAFARPGPLPVRVDLKTGAVRVLKPETFKGQGRTVNGGAATVLDLPLDGTKELKSITVRAIANEVIIGLMSVTLQR